MVKRIHVSNSREALAHTKEPKHAAIPIPIRTGTHSVSGTEGRLHVAKLNSQESPIDFCQSQSNLWVPLRVMDIYLGSD